MICAGIDAGSRAIKIVLLDADTQAVVGSGIADQGVHQGPIARELMDRVLAGSGLARADVHRTIATGYARGTIAAADATITEITCHACGVRRLLPETVTVIEIGGQDSKVIRLEPRGGVQDFAMNDRCAAGTGRFLEVVASRLGVSLVELGEQAIQSTRPAAISSMCVVFAETEIIGLLAAGVIGADIAAGIQKAIASRISSMAGMTIRGPVAFTGGMALVPGMDAAIAGAIGCPVTIPPNPQMTGALGAALLAAGHGGGKLQF